VYALSRILVGPQSGYGHCVEKDLLPTLGIESRSVQQKGESNSGLMRSQPIFTALAQFSETAGIVKTEADYILIQAYL
jgi:hypothetical protein